MRAFSTRALGRRPLAPVAVTVGQFRWEFSEIDKLVCIQTMRDVYLD